MEPISVTNSPIVNNTHRNFANIQLLVIDIDGTIAGENNDVRKPVKEAITAAMAKGIKVAIATGRMYRSALRFHREINSNMPLICYQGALIQDPKNEKIYRHLPVSIELALHLLEYLEQAELKSLIPVHFYINDQLYVREITSETEFYAQRSGIQPIAVGDLRQILTTGPTKVLAISHDRDRLNYLLNTLRQRYRPTELYVTTSSAIYIEATNPLVNKGTAVSYLAEKMLGLQPANVMTIGDNFNDLEMIEYAGIGVAMDNAPTPIKDVAQWVAPSVENDGVAAAIAEFLL